MGLDEYRSMDDMGQVIDADKPVLCPAVVIFPDWTGLDGYEKQRAHLLAKQGYVAFVIDISGDELMASWPAVDPLTGEIPDKFTHYGAAAGKYQGDAALRMSKVKAGFNQLLTYTDFGWEE